MLVEYKADLIIISLKINLFLPRYSWTIAELALNNNQYVWACMTNSIENILFLCKNVFHYVRVCHHSIHYFVCYTFIMFASSAKVFVCVYAIIAYYRYISLVRVSCRGGSRGGGGHPARPPKIGKHMIFWCKIVIFHTKYPNNFPPPSARRNFFKSTPLTWNPGSAPVCVCYRALSYITSYRFILHNCIVWCLIAKGSVLAT